MVLACLFAFTVLIMMPLKHLEAVDMKEVQLGDTVTLHCNISFYNFIHWLKMSTKGQPVALMVTSLKHTGELSVVWNSNKTHFEGFIEKQIIGLRILSVSTSDLATYYCATLHGNRMDFDKGVQLYINKQGNQKKNCFDHVQGFSIVFDGSYQIFAAVLSLGLLGMLLAVSVVHIKTRTKNIENSEKN